MDKIKEELLQLSEDIKADIDGNASDIWEDGCLVFSFDSGHNYVICRANSHDWQKELAKDLEEQKQQSQDSEQ